MIRRHWGQHEPSCFGCKLLTVQFEGIEAQTHRDKDSSLDKDLVAYKSLRQQGVQPKHVFGSAEVQAQAQTKFEVEHHMVMSDSVRKEFIPRLTDAGAA